MPNQPNVTGLSALGEALANGSRDYANLQIADRLRKEQRANQLADVADTRAYSDNVRQQQLQDAKAMEVFRAQQNGLQIMRSEGLLPMDREPTAEEFSVASQRFAAMGLDKLYKELLTTPDKDGKPLLTQADLGDVAKIAAAKDSLGAIKAQQLQFTTDQPRLQQQDFSRLREQEHQIELQMKTLSDDLERTADYIPTEAEIKNAALSLARQNVKPGKVPSSDDIEAQRDTAIKMLHDAGLERQVMEKNRKTVQLTALNQQLQAIRSQAQGYISRGLGPTAPAAASAALTPPTAATKPAVSPVSFAQMLSDEMAKRNPVTAPAAETVLANPTSDPMIAEENTRRTADDWQKNLADPYNEALDRVNAINDQISQVRSGVTPPMITPGGGPFMIQPTKSERAEKLSNLFVELDQAKRDVEEKRRAMLGVKARSTAIAPAAAVAPRAMLSNPVPASPMFDQSVPAFTSPSLLKLPTWFSAAPAGG